MTSRTEERLLSEADLYRLPGDGMRHELMAGVLVSEQSPGPRHGRVAAAVVAHLRNFTRRRRLGVVYTTDAAYVLFRSPDTVRGPDVSFVSMDRFEEVGDVETAFPGPPDLAVEVLSPGDRPGEVRAKVAEYLAAGTRLVWIVDPGSLTVTVYRSLFAPRRLEPHDRLDGEDVIPGFDVAVREFFEI